MTNAQAAVNAAFGIVVPVKAYLTGIFVTVMNLLIAFQSEINYKAMKIVIMFGVGLTLFFFTFGESFVSGQIQPVRVNPLRANNTKPAKNKSPSSATVPASGTIITASGTVLKNDSTNNAFNQDVSSITPLPLNDSETSFVQPVPANTTPNTAPIKVTNAESEPPLVQITDPLPQTLNSADPFATGTTPFPASPTSPVVPTDLTNSDLTELTPTPINDTNLNILPAMPRKQLSVDENVGLRGEAVAQDGTGTPGPSGLEGAQTPHLTLEKVLPAEIVVDQPLTIKTVVKNIGRSTVKNVTIRDRIPQGTRLLSTTPKAATTPDGELVWSLGNLDGSEQLIVEMRVLPIREGEIGSVAVVNYYAEASSRSMVTRPRIQVEVKAPQDVRLGEVANVEITIHNPGTATATGIIIEEYIPDGLYHKDGKVLINKNVDSLKPKERKMLTLPLTCVGAGVLQNKIIVKANGNLKAEEKTIINALAPVLDLKIVGAKQRFLERSSDFRLIVSNKGTASANEVELKLALPVAMQFVSTNQSGVYEPSTHTVHWALQELPAETTGEIDLVLMPAKIGSCSLLFAGSGKNNLQAETKHAVSVDGISAISFEVTGNSNLVEIGKDAIYEIKVANKGTKGAENVRVNAQLSDGMSFVNADGPVGHQSKNRIVQFEPLAQLDAKGEKVYKISARCDNDGDHRITVQIISDELQKPITKEESTRVFR
ncbi:MAG: DUF11 domain-containing protein [Planctomycetaceae bacterium]|jgi:uncharacterized repeat protein (TIGR01451 family)|nr:DUF11 domain-containing protein [Planctomycetaceae bacterium]